MSYGVRIIFDGIIAIGPPYPRKHQGPYERAGPLFAVLPHGTRRQDRRSRLESPAYMLTRTPNMPPVAGASVADTDFELIYSVLGGRDYGGLPVPRSVPLGQRPCYTALERAERVVRVFVALTRAERRRHHG